MSAVITKQAEDYLEAVVQELELPRSRYEQAERSYMSLGDWLHRDDSSTSCYEPDVFVQGSFKLGTAIKPQSENEEYDIDCCCTLTQLDKSRLSQAQLKTLLGNEIKLYRKSKGITKPVHEGRRCWRLEYADGAQFHMDIVPSIPNGIGQRLLLESYSLDAHFADTAIAITDNETSLYEEITDDWPRSNPRGYAKWFESRMGDVFVRRRNKLLTEMLVTDVTASIEDIPIYRVRTPLQSAIMILKHHRDIRFAKDATNKPISIIITTLAAHAYQGEESIGDALMSILHRMEGAIEHDGQKFIIRNPTDALENFADKWEDHPERADAFFWWLKKAREDFSNAGRLVEHRRISSVLEESMGRDLTSRISNKTGKFSTGLLGAATAASTTIPNVAFPDSPSKPMKPDGFA